MRCERDIILVLATEHIFPCIRENLPFQNTCSSHDDSPRYPSPLVR